MSHLKNKLNFKIIGLIAVFIFLVILRFTFLGNSPPGMAHDEIIYSLTSKSLITRGIDITGSGLPLAFFKTNTEGNISMLPPLLLSPFFAVFPLNQFSISVFYVLISLLTALTVYYFSYYLFKNKIISILATLFFLISPWAFFLSRFTTESPFALLFFLLGITTLFKLRGKKLLIPFLLFVAGFFSYHGAKVIYPFIIPAALLYLVDAKVKFSKKSALTFFVASISVLILFIGISKLIPGSIISQRSDLFFLKSSIIADAVNQSRGLTIDNPLLATFSNKGTVMISIFARQYLTAFSPDVLFLHGDPRYVYSFFVHGLFYYFDFVFIFAGLIYIWLKFRKQAILLSTLLLIAPLPSAISGVEFSYVHRSFLMLPVLLIFSASGLYAILEYFKNKKYFLVVPLVLFVVITFSALNFFQFYFFRYPIQAGEFYSLNQRLEAKFIKESLSTNKPIVSITEEPGDTYLESVFYLKDNKVFNQMQDNIKDFNKGLYHFSNVKFTGSCPVFHEDTVYIVDWVKPCFPNNHKAYEIKNPKDNGLFYKVYNSSLCNNAKLNSSNPRKLSDYNIEQMDKNTFCNRWVSQ